MKKSAVYAAAVFAVLSLTGQAFARGGSVGGGLSQTGSPHQMSATTTASSTTGMQHGTSQGTMAGAASQGTMTGTSTTVAMKESLSGTAGHQSGMTASSTQTVSNK